MKTKTASVRLPKEMFEEIDNICDGVGCSRNDWIKDTLQDKLREENSQDQEVTKDTEPQKITVSLKDDEPKEEPKPIVEISEVKEPETIIKEVPQDNSNKPVVHFVPFNGKLLPFAKRYDI